MSQGWTVESSTMVVDDRWLRLRADRCRTPGGAILDPFYVIEAGAWVCILPLTSIGDVVLVEEYRHGARLIAPGLPGGAMDPHDADPIDAAIRELREETGYTAERMLALGEGFANWANHTNRVHYFLALDCRRTDEPLNDEVEVIEVSTRPLAEVLAPGFLTQSFHQANAFLALPHLRDRLVLDPAAVR